VALAAGVGRLQPSAGAGFGGLAIFDRR